MEYHEILNKMKSYYNPRNIAGMARFGINVKKAYGVPAPALRRIARVHRKDHALAERLWASGIHDAKGLAGLIDDPARVTEEQMERWARDFDSWAVVDGTCNNLFRLVHDKGARDSTFLRYLPLIKRGATDERNFVKKAVNWALRQMGKRNLKLRAAAIKAGKEIQRLDSKAARWIAADALRELASEKTVAMIRTRSAK
ncbi:MAG: DNA alkylation repair protein [Acidobacteriia bacterium]|nr:DNA alkylation repair protein [Terriglobia bacterium]